MKLKQEQTAFERCGVLEDALEQVLKDNGLEISWDKGERFLSIPSRYGSDAWDLICLTRLARQLEVILS